MVGRRGAERPFRIDLPEIKIGADGEREPSPLQRYETERSPLDRTCRSERIGRQFRDILNRALPHFSSSGVPFGQNHAVNVMATGIDPQTIAHGVKIEPRKVPPTASAASNGQMDGSGELSRISG